MAECQENSLNLLRKFRFFLAFGQGVVKLKYIYILIDRRTAKHIIGVKLNNLQFPVGLGRIIISLKILTIGRHFFGYKDKNLLLFLVL